MAFFKSKEDKLKKEEKRLKEEEKKIKELENKILNDREFYGKIGQIHQGLSEFGLWGVSDNGKVKFKSTTFQIYDDKILIERNKAVIQLSDIQEILQDENVPEAIILLNNGDAVPIQGHLKRELKAFINVIHKLMKEIIYILIILCQIEIITIKFPEIQKINLIN